MKKQKQGSGAAGSLPATKKLKQSVDSVFSRLEAANASFLTTAAVSAAAAVASRIKTPTELPTTSYTSSSTSPALMSLRVDQQELARRMERERRFSAGTAGAGGGSTQGPKASSAAAAAGGAAAAATGPARITWQRQGERTLVEVRSEQGHARGTSTSLEKDYLRLTSLPTLDTVRPPEVLREALEMIKRKWATDACDYKYACDQLKSIRQDLTVQHVRNRFTVVVYEVHARIAIEVHDWAEYRQCHSVLQKLYAEGIKGERAEFLSYGLLYAAAHDARLLAHEMKESFAAAPEELREERFVGHALAVVRAFMSCDYVEFVKLYQTAPRMSPYLLDLLIAKLRSRGYGVVLAAYMPSVPIKALAKCLGFDNKKQAAAFVASKNGVVTEGSLDIKLSRQGLKLC